VASHCPLLTGQAIGHCTIDQAALASYSNILGQIISKTANRLNMHPTGKAWHSTLSKRPINTDPKPAFQFHKTCTTFTKKIIFKSFLSHSS
ncbi:unnamed protein product, partial [Dovyalis caffra]